MPPKKAAAKKSGSKGKGKDEGIDVTSLMRKIRLETNRALTELHISPEEGGEEVAKIICNKFQEQLTASSTKLIISGDKPGPIGIQAITLVMRELTPAVLPMKSLCFWKTQIGDDGLKAVCQNVLPIRKKEDAKYPGFINLELADCHVTQIGCDYLAQSLRTNIPLQSLVLDFNTIGDQGVTMLSEGLRYNKELATLSLGYCRIGPAGGAVIGDEVIRCSNLKRVRLPGNRIMEQGMMAIARNLGKSSTLLELDLSDNSIGEDSQALNVLCEGLRTNASLEKVNLDHNDVGTEGAILLMDTLGMCPNIKVFRVGSKLPAHVFKEVNRDGKVKKGGKKGKKKKK